MGTIYMAGAKPVRYIGKCEPCNRPVAYPIPENDRIEPRTKVFRNCYDCNAICCLELMYGVTNKMICDDRCMGAYGPDCVCGCGGVNHGGIWSETIDNVPAHVVEAYHKDQERRAAAAATREENRAAKKLAAFEQWAGSMRYHSDVRVVVSYTGDNSFVLQAQAKVEAHEILSDNYLKAVVRVVDEEIAEMVRREAQRQVALHSEHQGEVGEKITATLTVVAIIRIVDKYAHVYRGQPTPTKPVYKFTDERGNVFAWFASSYQAKVNADGTFGVNDLWEVGDTFTVEATVKKHDEYEGIKQTVITRAKVKKQHS